VRKNSARLQKASKKWALRIGATSICDESGCCYQRGRVRSRRSATERAAPANQRPQANPTPCPEITSPPTRYASSTPPFTRDRVGLRAAAPRSRRARSDAPTPGTPAGRARLSERAAPANQRAQALSTRRLDITSPPTGYASSTPPFTRNRVGLRAAAPRSRRARSDAPTPGTPAGRARLSERAAPANQRAQALSTRRLDITSPPTGYASSTPPFYS
jgi:hypothetical protein